MAVFLQRPPLTATRRDYVVALTSLPPIEGGTATELRRRRAQMLFALQEESPQTVPALLRECAPQPLASNDAEQMNNLFVHRARMCGTEYASLIAAHAFPGPAAAVNVRQIAVPRRCIVWLAPRQTTLPGRVYFSAAVAAAKVAGVIRADRRTWDKDWVVVADAGATVVLSPLAALKQSNALKPEELAAFVALLGGSDFSYHIDPANDKGADFRVQHGTVVLNRTKGEFSLTSRGNTIAADAITKFFSDAQAPPPL